MEMTSSRGGGASSKSNKKKPCQSSRSADQCPPPSYSERAAAAVAVTPSKGGGGGSSCSRRARYDYDILRIPSFRELQASRELLERTTDGPPAADVSTRKRYNLKHCATASIDKDISASSSDKIHSKETLHKATGATGNSLDKSYCHKTAAYTGGQPQQNKSESIQLHEDDELSRDEASTCSYLDYCIGGRKFQRQDNTDLPSPYESASDVSSDRHQQQISRNDVEALAHNLQYNNAQSSWTNTCNHDMVLDENNVPCIDRAYSPPPPSASSQFFDQSVMSGVTTSRGVSDTTTAAVAANEHFPQRSSNSKFFKRHARKFTSFRFRKSTKSSSPPASFRNRAGSDISTMSRNNPRITITSLRDGASDILLPRADKNGTNSKASAVKTEAKIQFIGDEASLYGTPKEEMSPNIRDVEGGQKSNHSATNYLKDQIISFFQPSDNKLAMKLFGNKNALMKEKQRQKAAGNWVVHPCSNFRYGNWVVHPCSNFRLDNWVVHPCSNFR